MSSHEIWDIWSKTFASMACILTWGVKNEINPFKTVRNILRCTSSLCFISLTNVFVQYNLLNFDCNGCIRLQSSIHSNRKLDPSCIFQTWFLQLNLLKLILPLIDYFEWIFHQSWVSPPTRKSVTVMFEVLDFLVAFFLDFVVLPLEKNRQLEIKITNASLKLELNILYRIGFNAEFRSRNM